MEKSTLKIFIRGILLFYRWINADGSYTDAIVRITDRFGDIYETILKISDDVDAIFVVGDKTSSNTKRLFEISLNNNKKASTYLVSSESDLTSEMLNNKHYVVLTSGTSTPPEVINSVKNRIEELSK